MRRFSNYCDLSIRIQKAVSIPNFVDTNTVNLQKHKRRKHAEIKDKNKSKHAEVC